MPLVEYERKSGQWSHRQYASTTVEVPGGGDDSWTPAQLGFVARPTGPNYIAIEDIPGVGMNLRLAAVHPAAHNKVITLPTGLFELNDFAQGDGNLFMHGLMVNPDTSSYWCRGLVGSGAATIIQMVPNSSHFTETSALQNSNPPQYTQTIIWFYGVNNVEFGNMTLQGQPQPHLHHGLRINGANAHVHHLRSLGSGYGTFNMPPGETYSLGVNGANALIEDCEFDGRRSSNGSPVSSTTIGILGCTNAVIRRTYCHDMVSGFGVVQWLGAGMTTEDLWVVRPGSGTGGNNGAHTNHEMGTGPIRHYRPHIELDGYWGPTDGKPRRNNAKFPHFVFLLDTNEGASPNAYADTQIIEPTYDSWGGISGGFSILMDEVAITATTKPQIIVNNTSLTPTIRPRWWVDSPAINTAQAYWIGANSGDGSLWG